MADCTGPGPAAEAGIRAGDVIVKVGDTSVGTFDEARTALQEASGPTTVVYERDGETSSAVVDVTRTQRFTGEGDEPTTVGAIGIAAAQFGPTQYNPLSAVPATFAFTGDLAVELGKSLAKIPTKIGALVHSIGGGERDPETPISVVGASIIGGDTVDARAVGGVLVLPRPAELRARRDQPGSAAAVRRRPHRDCVFEKIRNMIRSARGMVAAAPVNYLKLMPATYVDPVRGGRLHAADRHR